jgi:hypothetical protein
MQIQVLEEVRKAKLRAMRTGASADDALLTTGLFKVTGIVVGVIVGAVSINMCVVAPLSSSPVCSIYRCLLLCCVYACAPADNTQGTTVVHRLFPPHILPLLLVDVLPGLYALSRRAHPQAHGQARRASLRRLRCERGRGQSGVRRASPSRLGRSTSAPPRARARPARRPVPVEPAAAVPELDSDGDVTETEVHPLRTCTYVHSRMHSCLLPSCTG